MNTLLPVQGTVFQERKVLILMDSMGTDVRHLYRADIIAKKGCTIERLERKIQAIDIGKYKCIIIVIGTNDLSHKNVWFEYQRKKNTLNYKLEPHPTTDVDILKDRYKSLLNSIKSRNPSIMIELSPIIPRLFDYDINLSYLKSVNNMIKELCRTYHHEHDRTLITAFLKCGKPDPTLYLNDGLHLNGAGTDKLIRILRSKVAKLIQKLA